MASETTTPCTMTSSEVRPSSDSPLSLLASRTTPRFSAASTPLALHPSPFSTFRLSTTKPIFPTRKALISTIRKSSALPTLAISPSHSNNCSTNRTRIPVTKQGMQFFFSPAFPPPYAFIWSFMPCLELEESGGKDNGTVRITKISYSLSSFSPNLTME